MTVSIEVNNVSLEYRIRKKLSLALLRPPALTGGSIQSSNKGRNVIKALNNISFSLKAGDRLGLIGSNGAGKTTLLKVLYGIYAPTSGSVKLNGRVDALFNIRLGFRPEASGRRNIVLRGLINGWTEHQINERMEKIIEFSELGEFIELPLKIYSQGMAARLAFAVATAMDPEILLMDEWIGAGDAKFQEKAKERMTQLSEKAGIIVLASHDDNIIKKNCNIVLELEKGSIKKIVK